MLIVGLEAAGKTTFLEQVKGAYVRGHRPAPPSAIPPTIGMNLAKATVQDMDVTLWDVGGSMRGIWSQYYGEADGLVFVVDAANPARFGEAASTLELILSRPETASLPVLVLANKTDVPGAARASEVVDAVCRPAGLGSTAPPGGPSGAGATAGAATGRREFRIFEISALKAAGVRDAVEWVVSAAKDFVSERD